MNTANFMVKTSLGILILLVLVYADVGRSNINYNERCQVNKTNHRKRFCL